MTEGSPFRMDTAATARPVAIPCMAGHCLFQALQTIGVVLADHIIVADDDFVSMAQSGYLS